MFTIDFSVFFIFYRKYNIIRWQTYRNPKPHVRLWPIKQYQSGQKIYPCQWRMIKFTLYFFYSYFSINMLFFTESCAGVSCGSGRRCVVRGGRARCVCAAACRRVGAVCGSDGRTYPSLCRLRRRACRRPAKHLVLDYPGPCQGKAFYRAMIFTLLKIGLTLHDG